MSIIQKTLRSKKGISMLECIIALTIIGIISATAISITSLSKDTYSDTMQKYEARTIADNTLTTFQFANDYNEYTNTIRTLFDTNSNGFVDSLDVSDDKEYRSNLYYFDHIVKNLSDNSVSLRDGNDTIIKTINTDNGNVVINNSEKLADGYKFNSYYLKRTINISSIIGSIIGSWISGKDSDYTWEQEKYPAELKYINGSIIYSCKNIYLGNKDNTEYIPDKLYYANNENLFYGISPKDNKWYKYSLTVAYNDKFSDYNSVYGYWSKEEATDVTDIPEACKYSADTISGAMNSALNFFSQITSGNPTTAEEYYYYKGSRLYALNTVCFSTREICLLDDTNQPIITKTYNYTTNGKNALKQEFLNFNNGNYIEDVNNSYKYKYTHTVTTESEENVDYSLNIKFEQKGRSTNKYWQATGNVTENEFTPVTGYTNITSKDSEKYATVFNKLKEFLNGKTDITYVSGSYSFDGNALTIDTTNKYIYYKMGYSSKTTYYYSGSRDTFTTKKTSAKKFTDSEIVNLVLGGFINNSTKFSVNTSSTIKITCKGKKITSSSVSHQLIKNAVYSSPYAMVNTDLNGLPFEDEQIKSVEDEMSLSDFKTAQRSLNTDTNYQFMEPEGDYKYIYGNKRIFTYIVLNSVYNEDESNTVSNCFVEFYDDKDILIYSLPLYTADKLDLARQIIERTKIDGASVYQKNGDNRYDYKLASNGNSLTVIASPAQLTLYFYTGERENLIFEWTYPDVTSFNAAVSSYDYKNTAETGIANYSCSFNVGNYVVYIDIDFMAKRYHADVCMADDLERANKIYELNYTKG